MSRQKKLLALFQSILSMDQEMQNQEMYMKAKKEASMKVATQFNMLNVMQDLGQSFESFEKEGE